MSAKSDESQCWVDPFCGLVNLHLWSPSFIGFGGGITAFSRDLALALQPLGTMSGWSARSINRAIGAAFHYGERQTSPEASKPPLSSSELCRHVRAIGLII